MTNTPRTHRFGLLTPSSNSTQEPEFAQILMPAVSLHTGRLGFTHIDAENMMRCVKELEYESRKLADAEVGVIVFAATAPSVANGRGYDRELIKRIEDASGKPATTASTAFLDALAHLGIRRIAIAAPWSETVNKTVVRFMSDNGLEVVNNAVMGLVRNTDLGHVSAESAYELAMRADSAEADAVIIPGGNWPTASVVERLECDLAKPVLTNNAVSIWAGLRMLGRGGSIAGYGRLLRDHLGGDAMAA